MPVTTCAVVSIDAVAVALTPTGVQAPPGAAIVTVGALVYPDPEVNTNPLTLRKVPVVFPLFADALMPPAGAGAIVAVGRAVYPLPAADTPMEETP